MQAKKDWPYPKELEDSTHSSNNYERVLEVKKIIGQALIRWALRWSRITQTKTRNISNPYIKIYIWWQSKMKCYLQCNCQSELDWASVMFIFWMRWMTSPSLILTDIVISLESKFNKGTECDSVFRMKMSPLISMGGLSKQKNASHETSNKSALRSSWCGIHSIGSLTYYESWK